MDILFRMPATFKLSVEYLLWIVFIICAIYWHFIDMFNIIDAVTFEQLEGGIAYLSVGGHGARIDGGVFFHKMCVFFWNAKIHIFSDMDKKHDA